MGPAEESLGFLKRGPAAPRGWGIGCRPAWGTVGLPGNLLISSLLAECGWGRTFSRERLPWSSWVTSGLLASTEDIVRAEATAFLIPPEGCWADPDLSSADDRRRNSASSDTSVWMTDFPLLLLLSLSLAMRFWSLPAWARCCWTRLCIPEVGACSWM